MTNEHNLAGYPWPLERDRWAELVFCLLNQVHPQDSDRVRSAVMLLQALDLLDMDKLAAIERSTEEHAFVLGYVLRQQGFEEDEAARSITILTQAARVIQSNFDSKLQRYLRRHGEAMRDELVNLFGSKVLANQELRYAVSQWLQNALNLPISLEHKAVLDFCEKQGVSQAELQQAVDKLGLNLALVDDLLEMNMEMVTVPLETEPVSEVQE